MNDISPLSYPTRLLTEKEFTDEQNKTDRHKYNQMNNKIALLGLIAVVSLAIDLLVGRYYTTWWPIVGMLYYMALVHLVFHISGLYRQRNIHEHTEQPQVHLPSRIRDLETLRRRGINLGLIAWGAALFGRLIFLMLSWIPV